MDGTVVFAEDDEEKELHNDSSVIKSSGMGVSFI